MGHELGYDNENIDDNYLDMIYAWLWYCDKVMVTLMWDELYEPEINNYRT